MLAGKRDISKEVEMMKAVSEVLLQRKQNPGIDNEELMKLITRYISVEGSQESKIYMIAAASKAVSFIEKNPLLSDKEIIRQVMAELSSISRDIEFNNSLGMK